MVSPSERPQRITRLAPLDFVLARMNALVKPVEPRRAGISAALLGSTLAEDVVLDAPVPPIALALRDGWAVASEMTANASSYAPAPLAAAVQVNVGETMPAGADAIVPLDAVTVRGDAIEALTAVAPGDGVLPEGGDVACAGVLLHAGRRLGYLELALLRATGVTDPLVRVPRLRVARARPRRDRMIDAVAECIAGTLRCVGALVSDDANDRLEAAFGDSGVDAVIAIGGTGDGADDRAVSILASLGELIVHGVALVPAETSALAIVGRRPVLVLPGRFDAALAAWHMLGRGMLTRLNAAREEPTPREAKLTHKITSAPGLAELVPVRCEGLFATPIAAGYVPLSALADANGWVFVPPASEGYPAQSEVMIRPWP